MAMDMMAGAGAPPMAGPGGGGPPVDLAALLGAGGGGGPDAAQAPTPAPGGDQPQDGITIIEGMLENGKQYLDVEPDHEDLLTMQKILTQLQQLLTKDQQDADQAMQGSTNPRAMRKAFGG